MRTSSSSVSAILLAALGIGLLSLMDATIKGLSDRYGVTGIAFSRYVVGTLVMAAVLAALRPGWPSAETWRTNGLRAVLVVVTALCFFHGLSVLPLAEALALSFLSPIFIALFAAWLLRERVRPPVWAGLVVGFAGVGIVVAGQVGTDAPRAAGSAWGIAAILASALTYALSMVLLRARARHDPVVTIVAIQNAGPAAMLAVPAAWTWTPVAAPTGRSSSSSACSASPATSCSAGPMRRPRPRGSPPWNTPPSSGRSASATSPSGRCPGWRRWRVRG